MKHCTFIIFVAGSFLGFAQPIHRTACRGDIAVLDSLLQSSYIEIQDNRGRSLLHWAVACKKMDVIHYLMAEGIDLNAEDSNNHTAMHVAIAYDLIDYFDTLAKLQPNHIWKNNYGPSLMEKAILNKSTTCLERLLHYGIDINAVNHRGSSPLEIAMRVEDTVASTWLIAHGADTNRVRKFTLKGPYLGQQPSIDKAVVFAPNFISTEQSEFGSVFNAVGTEFYYAVDVNGKNDIRFTEMIDNQWTTPKVILSHHRYGYNDPFLSPDEQRLYFISNQPKGGIGDPKDIDIWYAERTADDWSAPIHAGPMINTDSSAEYYISFTQDGRMYYGSDKQTAGTDNAHHDIYYSDYINGVFQPSVRLGDSINTDAYEADVFVAPDESYLIFCAMRSDSYGRGDLYISFKNKKDEWTAAVNMGESINTVYHELCPFVTSDGKYLFFTSNQDIYWIDAGIISNIKSKHTID